MKIDRFLFCFLFLFLSIKTIAQHHLKMVVEVDNASHIATVSQELTYFNQSESTLNSIVLNDWNNAYSVKNSPLGKRFSDEFVRSFHFAPEKDRGATLDLKITTASNQNVAFFRPENFIDLVEIPLEKPLLPNQKVILNLSYKLKIPNGRFTDYGYNSKGEMNLKNWFLTPANFIKNDFVRYSNLNLDDAANALFDLDLEIKSMQNFEISSDLEFIVNDNFNNKFKGKNLLSNSVFILKKDNFESFKNDKIEVSTNLQSKKITGIQKALAVDKVVNFVSEKLGSNSQSKITVSQYDYDQNPFYGLNQLPSFLRPFPEELIYELKFLKTYLNTYLKSNLLLDSRKDNWVFDAIQMHCLMEYMNENYPNSKMMGNLATYKLLRGYNLVSLDFNEQFSYFYLLMARKNLDQPLGDSKETYIRFNEKIALKYRAGLSLHYLESYIGKENVQKSILEFATLASKNQTNSKKFEEILKKNTAKNIDWFFETVINTRQAIDYKFKNVTKSDDKVSFELKNKTESSDVPLPVFGLKSNKVVFQEWIQPKTDSVYTLNRFDADKLVINFNNDVPEINRRNNWKSLKSFSIGNKPFKFNFLKDLENPKFNQILYVPTVGFNFYDGVIFGLEFHNRTILDRPFNFDLIPSYSSKTKSLSGSFSVAVNQFNRDSNLYNIKYGFSGSTFKYAPDANYQKVNPYVILRFRPDDFRSNERSTIVARQVFVNREKSNFLMNDSQNTFDGSYSIFDARYSFSKPEITRTFAYLTDLQVAQNFGKATAEVVYRKLYTNNRQINLRLYAGYFLYNSTNSDFFNFALDRPTDYLFDYAYLARSDTKGLLSQEYITAEGGFKSKLSNPSSNQFLAAVNGSFNVWNWVEIYGDLGIMKSKNQEARFVYDQGIRLNLVPDYFELYFPITSNNGWEMAQKNYQEKIRFVFVFNPNSLLGLFTRKWF